MKAPAVKRLIEWCEPSHYDLDITIDPGTLHFSGIVAIQANLTQKALREKVLYLHANELTVTEIDINGTSVEFARESEHEIQIKLDTYSPASGQVQVRITYTGIITEQMHGIYPCNYKDDNQDKLLIATQFESHHAREAFPCIDEPSAKATFCLNLTTPQDGIALSNTAVIDTIKTTTTTTYKFAKTPRMSTYLLAWVWGDLVGESSVSRNGKTISLYSTRPQASKGAYGLDVATQALDYLEKYFGVDYPLDKCDLVALPDFAASAMENWGLITFREESLLIDKHSDLHDKQYCANVVIHELAHQWFGNLVTMKWWNDLWLNEGFASWIPYLVIDHLYPSWKIWEQFSTGDLAIGLSADSLHHTHPIVVDIYNPDEIRSAFDSISYDKGCSVVHMVYLYIGADDFQKGLQLYFKRHAYKNAETYDLWDAWATVSGKDVAGYMKAWTETPGYPLLQVDGNATTFTVSQHRFTYDNAKNTQLWPVPLHRHTTDSAILSNKKAEFTQFSKLNFGQQGFYRVNYAENLLSILVDNIQKGQLPDIDTQGLLADSYEIVKAGQSDVSGVLDLVMAVKDSTSEPLISKAVGILLSVRSLLPDLYEELKPVMSTLIESNSVRLGTELRKDEPVSDTLLRPTILACGLYGGDETLRSEFSRIFDTAKKPEDIRPDIRSSVYKAGLMTNPHKAYETLLEWYTATNIPGEQSNIGASLCSVEQEELYARSLQMIRSKDVRLQDVFIWLGYALRNRKFKHLAWQWVQENWAWIGEIYGAEKEIDYILRYCADGFTDPDHLQRYTQFFGTVDIFGSTRAFEQGKEMLKWQIAFRQSQLPVCKEWINKFS